MDRDPHGGDGLRRRDHDRLPDGQQHEGDPHRGVVRRDHRRRPHRHRPEREPLLARPRPDRGRLGDVLPLLRALGARSGDHPHAAPRARDRRRAGVRGRRLGGQPHHHHDRRGRAPRGHGGLALARQEHRPAGQQDELGAPRQPRPRPPCSRLRVHRRQHPARGRDAPHEIRAPDLPPRREPGRRAGRGAADHAPHRGGIRHRIPLHRRLRDPDRRDERKRLAPPRRQLHVRRDRGRAGRGNAVTGGRGSIARTALGAIFIATISDMLLLRGYSTGGQILVRGIIVVVVVVLTNLRERNR